MNIPTLLTLFRIVAIPVIVICYYLPIPLAHPLASCVFIVAALTDWFDGYLARVLQQTTSLGAFLDPVADKLLVAISLTIILPERITVLLPFAAAVIIGREIVISALREWMAELGKRASVAVAYIAKIKTVMQMFALGFLLWYHPGTFWWVSYVGSWLLYIAAILTLWTMLNYLKIAWKAINA